MYFKELCVFSDRVGGLLEANLKPLLTVQGTTKLILSFVQRNNKSLFFNLYM